MQKLIGVLKSSPVKNRGLKNKMSFLFEYQGKIIAVSYLGGDCDFIKKTFKKGQRVRLTGKNADGFFIASNICLV